MAEAIAKWLTNFADAIEWRFKVGWTFCGSQEEAGQCVFVWRHKSGKLRKEYF